jgi:protocatechuate 3,4-dioxygenase beta subunit
MLSVEVSEVAWLLQMVRVSLIFFLVQVLLGSCQNTASDPSMAVREDSTSATDTCNDPDAHIGCCFLNMPETLTHVMQIAPMGITGDRIIVNGRSIRGDGTPLSGAILYVYHTDHTGHYSKIGNETGFQKWHGHLHGWCVTDSLGRYELHTIRPAPYPSNTMPAHIHCAIKEPSGRLYYINDFVFKDDSLVNDRYLRGLNLTGGNGIVDLRKNLDGIWLGERDIVID